ncbi:hypothetical protein DMH88_11990 [Escherichia coli]|nr:hypothetical protein [Escherichia coli]
MLRGSILPFCQLLEQLQQNAPLGSTDSPAADAVRFRPHPGWAFRSAS